MLNIDTYIAKIFLPDDEGWLKHANPWSIWTRFATLPFLVLAVWSRVWIGWYALPIILMLIVWILINPTLFKKPQNFDSWGAKAVLGERVLMKRKTHSIPDKHKTPIVILNILQMVGGAILVYGLWDLNIYLTIHGITFVYLAKMWFLDRMVWLYEDTQ